MTQDILITPGSGEPQILFRGSGTNDTPIELNVLSSYQSASGSGTALLFEGQEGQLFAVTDNLSSGTIFSVGDITGLSMLSVDASGDVKLGEFANSVIVYPGLTLDDNVPSTTSNVLYNDGGDLMWNGVVVLASDAAQAINGSGTASYVARFTDSNTLSTGVLYDNGTNVGIGTASPSYKLDVNGVIASIGTSDKGAILGDLKVGYDNLYRTIQTHTDGEPLFLQYDHAGNTVINRIGGNVGIGTVSPSEKLHVVGNIKIVDGSLNLDNDYGISYNPLEGSVETLRYCLKFDATNNASYPFLTNRTPNGKVVIKTGTSAGGAENTHFTIEGGDGTVNSYFENTNVGIGTTSPQQKLHIDEGNIRIEKTTDPTVEFNNGSANRASVFYDTSEETFVFNHADASLNQLVLTSGNNVGIGTNDPNSTLHVYSATSGDNVFNVEGTNGSLFGVTDNLSGVLMSVNTIAGLPVLEVNSDYSVTAGRFNQNDFTISSSGNVGIGTDSPSEKLHVAGDVLIDGGGTTIGGTTWDNGLLKIGTSSAGISIDTNEIFSNDIMILGTLNASSSIEFRHGNTVRIKIISGGNVGIGTISPSYKLDVNGTAGFSSTINAANIGTGQDDSVVILDSDGKLRTDEIDSRVWGSSLVDGAGSSGNLAFWNDANTLTYDSQLHWHQDSNRLGINIGSNTPKSALEVNGHISLTPTSSTTGWNNTFYTYNNTNSNNSYGFTLGYQASTSRYSHMIFAPEYADIAFKFDGSNVDHEVEGQAAFTTRMLIRGDTGRVGIGKEDPNSTLHVYSATSGTDLFNVEGTNGSLFSIVDSLSGSLMSVNNIVGLPVFEVFDDDTVIAGRYGENDLYVSSSGDVGLGTANPTEKLHVEGNVRVSGAYYDSSNSPGSNGQVLSSTVSGTDWTDLPTINNGTLTMNVGGTGLSGSATFTANQSGNSTFTVTSNATSANTASTIVARDSSGNFSAGTITATQVNVDNLRLDGNTLSSTNTNGNINITPNGTGGINAGSSNTVTGIYSTVGGGRSNTVSGNYQTIAGGRCNTTIANRAWATISGGYKNYVGGYFSFIGAGCSNTANGNCSVIGGGRSNYTWINSVVGGGLSNSAGGDSAMIGGGRSNTSDGTFSTIGGGCKNYVNARHGSINGGHYNVIQSPTNQCCSRGATIGGGVGHNTTGGTVDITTGDISGTVTCCNAGSFSTIGGGCRNIATGNYSTVSGGGSNDAIGESSTISGGQSNLASGNYSTVSGGRNNWATNSLSFVGGGSYNISCGLCSTISGGYSNLASGGRSTVGGGSINAASGDFSTVSGGYFNIASGNRSTVSGGYRGKASRYGEVAHAAGRFAQPGDAQHSTFVARRNTTDATANVELFLDGVDDRMILPAETTWTFDIKLSAYNDTDNTTAWWIIRGGIRRNAANGTTLIGSLIEERDYEGTMSGTSAAVTADDTNESLKIAVTGLAGKNIRWVAVVDVAQVSWGTP